MIKGSIAEKIKIYLAINKCVDYKKLRKYADENNIKPNTLYVTLHRLKKAGLVKKRKGVVCITREFKEHFL